LKLKYHSKDGTLIEIEGDPSELAHFTHELDTRKAGANHLDEMKQITIDATVDMLTRQKLRELESKEIARYIVSLGRSDMAHTMENLMNHFLESKLHSKKQQSAYLSFYSKVKGAHKILASEKNGTWKSSRDRGGKHTIYRLIQK